jgi:glycerol-3-phosphate acyltransferase PlsY
MKESFLSFYPLLYLIIPAGFIIGSIPFGILATKNKGVDLRTTGSKNIGATNVLRTAGKLPALVTLVGDVFKGAVPVVICNYIIVNIGQTAGNAELISNAKDFWGGVAGLSAIAGHIFSIFLSFKGGKGVATGLGVLIAYSPVSAIIAISVWIAVAVITKYSSLAAIVAVAALPITFAMSDFSRIKIAFAILFAILIISKHKENIKRLIEGKEPKIGKEAQKRRSAEVQK